MDIENLTDEPAFERRLTRVYRETNENLWRETKAAREGELVAIGRAEAWQAVAILVLFWALWRGSK